MLFFNKNTALIQPECLKPLIPYTSYSSNTLIKIILTKSNTAILKLIPYINHRATLTVYKKTKPNLSHAEETDENRS